MSQTIEFVIGNETHTLTLTENDDGSYTVETDSTQTEPQTVELNIGEETYTLTFTQNDDGSYTVESDGSLGSELDAIRTTLDDHEQRLSAAEEAISALEDQQQANTARLDDLWSALKGLFA